MTRNAARFVSSQSLQLEGFTQQPVPYGGLSARLLSDDALPRQFESFASRIVAAVGREYLPVYRMSDGEFIFMVGWQRPFVNERLLLRFRSWMSRTRNRVLRRPSPTMWGEAYADSERLAAIQRLETAVRHVALRGILAIYFMRRGDRWNEEFFEPVTSWLDDRRIELTPANYVPLYFAYALMNGPRRTELYSGRRILVVTHLNPERRTAIERGLRMEGAAAVKFLPVSASRAMFDDIDVAPFAGRVDLALVAAGIGSANVVMQLEPLAVPSIDAGITIDCLIDPGRRLERPFLLDDDRRGRMS
jgi:hypothetical protein